MEYISNQEIKPDIVVFLDGDYSDYPDELTQLIAPILENNIDFVVGSRVARLRENSMTPQQIFGNWLATTLMKIFFNATFTDLGPLEL
jgi:cellulose synthase/poly-beta-1,6-N-acetylglucosamine synthase-like glycosyltransferase